MVYASFSQVLTNFVIIYSPRSSKNKTIIVFLLNLLDCDSLKYFYFCLPQILCKIPSYSRRKRGIELLLIIHE
jgi:hypothetical protein